MAYFNRNEDELNTNLTETLQDLGQFLSHHFEVEELVLDRRTLRDVEDLICLALKFTYRKSELLKDLLLLLASTLETVFQSLSANIGMSNAYRNSDECVDFLISLQDCSVACRRFCE